MHPKNARRLTLETLENRGLMAAAGQAGSTQAQPLTRVSLSEGHVVIRGTTGDDK